MCPGMQAPVPDGDHEIGIPDGQGGGPAGDEPLIAPAAAAPAAPGAAVMGGASGSPAAPR